VELGASQVTGPSLGARATVQHPVGWNRLLPDNEPIPEAFNVCHRLGTRDFYLSFEAATPRPTRLSAYASPTPLPRLDARLTTRLPGSALAG